MNKDNPLYAFIQSVEVERNKQEEINRKNKVKEQTARAMNRAVNEWR
jgi:hypothetical protein